MRIECNHSDSPEPIVEGGVFRIRAPFALELGQGGEALVRTGVRFNVPVLLIEHHGTRAQGIGAANNATIVMPGEEIYALLKSRATEGRVAMFERGDTILVAVPLPKTDHEVVFLP